ncbi:MAG: hypothetical protein OEV01_12995 [Nitrospira sp.]|nr:hypothetical protein [Nitrospira sp.]
MHILVEESDQLDRTNQTRVYVRYALDMGILVISGSLRQKVEQMDVLEDFAGEMGRAGNKAIQGEGW